jgi:cytochrome c biogenesis protein CcmG/thiol:disulfide interchange protein DsbE
MRIACSLAGPIPGVNDLAAPVAAGDNAPMRAAVLAALVAVVTSCGGSAPPPAAATAIAEPMPALELPLLDGGAWSAASARGKVLVIDVWATWCKPCRKGFPALDALAAGRPDASVVAVSIDEDPAVIRAFLAETPLGVPVAHDAAQSVTAAPLAIARLPTVLVIEAAGVIRYRLVEPTERDYASLPDLVDAAATAVGSGDR